MTDLRNYSKGVYQCISAKDTFHLFEFMTQERAKEDFYNVFSALLNQGVTVAMNASTKEIFFDNGSCMQFAKRQSKVSTC